MRNSAVSDLNTDEIDDIREATDRALRVATRRHETADSDAIRTNVPEIDRLLKGGLPRGEIIFFSGKDYNSKLLASLEVSYNIASLYQPTVTSLGSTFASQGGSVFYYSTNMSAEAIATVIISEQTNISTNDIRTGNLNEDDFETLVSCSLQLQKVPIYIAETHDLSLGNLISKARDIKKSRDIDLLVISDFDAISAYYGRGRIETLLKELHELTIELDISLLCLADFTKKELETNAIPNARFLHFDAPSIHGVNYRGFSLAYWEHNGSSDKTSKIKLNPGLQNSSNEDFLARATALPKSATQNKGGAGGPTIQQVINFFGGPIEIARSVRNSTDLARFVQDGLPSSILEKFIETGITPIELQEIVAPKRTLARRRATGRLTPAEGDAAVRLAKTILLAASVLGSTSLAIEWLRKSHKRKLGGRTPMALLATEAGAAAIADILLAAAFGFNA
ncbi:DnaB-like helicase C-terminal domain-containing protein [Rhizobium leguminosarum]